MMGLRAHSLFRRPGSSRAAFEDIQRENSRGSPIMLKAHETHSVGRSAGSSLPTRHPCCFIEQCLGNYMRTSPGEQATVAVLEKGNRRDLATRLPFSNAKINKNLFICIIYVCASQLLLYTNFCKIDAKLSLKLHLQYYLLLYI